MEERKLDDGGIDNVFGFDTEDNGKGAPNNFILAAFIAADGSKYVFSEREEVRRFIFNRVPEKSLIFCHNLAYDLANVDYPEGSVKMANYTPSGLVRAVIPARHIVFLDVGAYFKTSLAYLGRLVGKEKYTYPVEKLRGINHIAELGEEEQENLINYCLRDAEITLLTGLKLKSLAKSYGVDLTQAPTISSLAFKIFMNRFYYPNIKKFKGRVLGRSLNNWQRNIQRRGYYGGRCEIFSFGVFPESFYYDINSSFPYAMLKPVPLCFESYYSKSYGIENLDGLYGVVFAKIKAPELINGVQFLPFRNEKGKLLFPAGEWSGVYTVEEALTASKIGYEVEVIDGYFCEEAEPIFKDYILEFYKMKKQAKPESVEYDFYKCLMNSLYGKFAERRKKAILGKVTNYQTLLKSIFEKRRFAASFFSDFPTFAASAQFFKGVLESYAFYNGWISGREKNTVDFSYSVPLISAYITSYAREKLFLEGMKKPEAVLYCDTDAVVTTDKLTLPISSELGDWKEKKLDEFQPIAPKVYRIGQKLKIKGVPKNSQKEGEFWSFEKPLKLRESIRRYTSPNLWLKIFKRLCSPYDKRIVLSDGKTRPLVIKYDPPEKSICCIS